MRVIGFDGYKAGWVAVQLDDAGLAGVEIGASVAEILDAHGPFDAVGVDMPIGLPRGDLREADRLARKMLGARASSVFPTPPRATLAAKTYEEASALSKADQGRGMSKQAFNLLDKIRELDSLVRAPNAPRIVEVHPEVSFRALNEAELPFYKKTWNGQMLRRRLLAAAGIVLPEQLDAAGHVPVDDVLDAAAVAWTARRVALGVARCLPDPPARDAEGVEMAIWY